MKTVLLIIGVVICVVIIAGFAFFISRISMPASDSDEIVAFAIDEGMGVRAIADQLEREGLIKSAYIFEIYVWVSRYDDKLLAGEYRLAKNLSTVELTRELVEGETNEISVTIIEGWNLQEIARYLKEQGVFEEGEFLEIAKTADTRTVWPDITYDFLLDKPVDQGLEGYLFPDTYRIYKDATPDQVVQKMLDNFGLKLSSELRQKIKGQGETIHDVLTLASIVEKEVRTEEDRKIAAGIFWDRLAIGKPLESDATVNYVTGRDMLQPTYEDTEVDSLYNTYRYIGLPPGPICNPSLESIEAVLNPTETDYLYFLTKPDGSTVFSQTYQEHLINKNKYLK